MKPLFSSTSRSSKDVSPSSSSSSIPFSLFFQQLLQSQEDRRRQLSGSNPEKTAGTLNEEEQADFVPLIFYFFSRNQGNYFTCHGQHAQYIAREYYRTSTVLKKLSGGLYGITITPTMLYRYILPGLLQENIYIEFYTQENPSSSTSPWYLEKHVSPGNISAVEHEILKYTDGNGRNMDGGEDCVSNGIDFSSEQMKINGDDDGDTDINNSLISDSPMYSTSSSDLNKRIQNSYEPIRDLIGTAIIASIYIRINDDKAYYHTQNETSSTSIHKQIKIREDQKFINGKKSEDDLNIGLCTLNTSFRTVYTYEFVDSFSLKTLESVLVQVGCRELVVPEYLYMNKHRRNDNNHRKNKYENLWRNLKSICKVQKISLCPAQQNHPFFTCCHIEQQRNSFNPRDMKIDVDIIDIRKNKTLVRECLAEMKLLSCKSEVIDNLFSAETNDHENQDNSGCILNSTMDKEIMQLDDDKVNTQEEDNPSSIEINGSNYHSVRETDMESDLLNFPTLQYIYNYFPFTLGASYYLFDHLNLVNSDSSSIASYIIQYGDIDKYMTYDSASTQAMNLFPSSSLLLSSQYLSQDKNQLYVKDSNLKDLKDSTEMEDKDRANPTESVNNYGFNKETPNRKALCLFNILNRTKTGLGSRCLYRWLLHPLRDPKLIHQRQCIVTIFFHNPSTLLYPFQSLLAESAYTHFDGSETMQRSRGKEDSIKAKRKGNKFPDLERIGQRMVTYYNHHFDPSINNSDTRTTIENKKQKNNLKENIRRSNIALRDLLDVYTSVTVAEKVVALFSKVLKAEHLIDVTDDTDIENFRKNYLDELSSLCEQMTGFQALVESVIDLECIAKSHGHEIRLNPSLDESLAQLIHKLSVVENDMNQTYHDLTKLFALDEGKLKQEHTQVHGYHLRATKKDQDVIRSYSNQGVRKKQSSKRKSVSEGSQKGKEKPRKLLNERNDTLIDSNVIILAVQRAGLLFTTATYRTLSDQKKNLKEEYKHLQYKMVVQIMEVALTYVPLINKIGSIIGEIDTLASFAFVANILDWSRPTCLDFYAEGKIKRQRLVAQSTLSKDRKLNIKGLRHPVVEETMSNPSNFIANDVTNIDKLLLITGPNAGGKSTYIRSIGIAVLLAQMGSYVPCISMEWRIFDKILARIGASDFQLRGISTFMAEMLDTQAILASATSESLVLIDELGRGTSTCDGLGIAWAVAHTLAKKISCTTLFTTHLHELTALADIESSESDERGECSSMNRRKRHKDANGNEKGRGIGISNIHFTALVEEQPSIIDKGKKRKRNKQLTFLYKIQEGPCDRSFGLHVAKLASFPQQIIDDAEEELEEVEADMTLSTGKERQMNSSLSDITDRERLELQRKFFHELCKLDPAVYGIHRDAPDHGKEGKDFRLQSFLKDCKTILKRNILKESN